MRGGGNRGADLMLPASFSRIIFKMRSGALKRIYIWENICPEMVIWKFLVNK